jgi:hypothetical protein
MARSSASSLDCALCVSIILKFFVLSSVYCYGLCFKKSLKILKGGNQNPYIEEEQTIQWPKEKVQKDKQRSTKHTYKTRDRVTRTPI